MEIPLYIQDMAVVVCSREEVELRLRLMFKETCSCVSEKLRDEFIGLMVKMTEEVTLEVYTKSLNEEEAGRIRDFHASDLGKKWKQITVDAQRRGREIMEREDMKEKMKDIFMRGCAELEANQ
jgi:hypothetical protein